MVNYLKTKSNSKVDNRPDGLSERVQSILADLREGKEQTAIDLAAKFDDWQGPIVVERETIEAARASLPSEMLDDITAAYRHIRDFATAQRASITAFDTEVAPGLMAGHRLVPVGVSGCYIPAGRFPHIASALMSVTTSSVAGVGTVVAASPARNDRGGVHPAILAAADLAGADVILGLGGVQAIGAMALGLFTGKPADMLVGPGNSYVAEAKRQLFGEVGIDAVAGPTESMIVADHTADAFRVATDLVGQAEHGADSPVWLVTTDHDLATRCLTLVPELAEKLPEPSRSSAINAWRDYGEIMVTETREEAAQVCDDYACEHLQVLAADLDWWHERLRNYGSLFLGEETTVSFGDKSAGPNHILPTNGAARYTGGLNVIKFMRQLTYQRLTPEAGDVQGELAGRISRYEGMEGHARSADLRVLGESAKSETDSAETHVQLDFTAQEPLPPKAVARANQLLASGKLFRYGETGGDTQDAALLESEFAALVGRRFCVGLNSCGSSMAVALMASGVGPGDLVLSNAFTLSPVPGAIVHAGAKPVFVGVTDNYHIDFDDLRRAAADSGARWLLLSHMRGHICNMDELVQICDELNLTVIEDCAHTMGASWGGTPTGRFGKAGCFSTQTFKHVNSGEGGLLVTDDEDVAAKAILMSGSYALYEQHGARPDVEVLERHRLQTPNFSMRLNGLAAALALPQLELLEKRAQTWNAHYQVLAKALTDVPGVRVPERDEREDYVASSILFSVESDNVAAVVDYARSRGVSLKWFGADDPVGFTSRFDHWAFAPQRPLEKTRDVLATLCDLRIPLSMSHQQAGAIVDVIEEALQANQ